MRFAALLIAVAFWLAGCAAGGPFVRNAAGSNPNQLLVVVAQSSFKSVLGDPSHAYRRRATYRVAPSTERILDHLARDYRLTRESGWPIPAIGGYCEVFSTDGSQSLEALLARLAGDPRVELAQPVQEFDVLAGRYNDPYLDLQHGFSKMQVAAAHRWASGNGVSVGVIDTGVDRGHEDLKGRIVEVRDFTPSDAPTHRGAHGTAVAGVIASVANNGEGIVGVAPDARIVDLRACWYREHSSGKATCDSFSLAKALGFAIERGINVVNLSLAGPTDPLLRRLIQAAVSRGTVVVGAARSGSANTLGFPANMPEVLAVVADSSGGTAVLRAPGMDVLTTVPEGAYDFVSGTSFSAAHVSGVVALVLEQQSQLTPAAVARLLRDTSNRLGINACAALANTAGRQSGDCKTDGLLSGTGSLRSPR